MDRADNPNNNNHILYGSKIMIGEIIFWVVATYVSYELNKELHRDIFDNGVEK